MPDVIKKPLQIRIPLSKDDEDPSPSMPCIRRIQSENELEKGDDPYTFTRSDSAPAFYNRDK
jgi:hypothetical protein